MTIDWHPISTAPRDGTWILLLGDSGYLGTPYRVAVGQWIPDHKNCWTDHAGDRFTDGGEAPTHWAVWDVPPLKARSAS